VLLLLVLLTTEREVPGQSTSPDSHRMVLLVSSGMFAVETSNASSGANSIYIVHCKNIRLITSIANLNKKFIMQKV
jgi:hypothetical protein